MKRGLVLTEGEWKVMNLLWERSPMEISDMVDALKDDTAWTRATVNTVLMRLIEKGCVRLDHSTRTRKYYPELTKKEAVRMEAEYSLSKVKTDSLGLLLCSLADAGELSDEDLKEIFLMLKDLRGEGGRE